MKKIRSHKITMRLSTFIFVYSSRIPQMMTLRVAFFLASCIINSPTMKMEAVIFPETSVDLYQNTQNIVAYTSTAV
jgi:hypothetical protein